MVLYEFLGAIISVFIFGFVERQIKEHWVLIDSFRRDRNIHIRVINTMQNPIYIVDTTGKILLFNKASESQITVNEKISLNLLNVVHSLDLQKVREAIKQALKGNTLEFEILMKSEFSNEDAKNTQPNSKITIPHGIFFRIMMKI